MSNKSALTTVFMQAFKSLPKKQRDAFLEELLKEEEYREDLIDLAIIESRKKEPKRPLREYLAEKKAKR